MKSMSVLEETGVEKGEDIQANRQSPQQLFRGALKGLGWSPLASTVPTFVQEGMGGGCCFMLWSTHSKERPCARAWQTLWGKPRAVPVSPLQPSAELIRTFPLKRCGLRAVLSE